LTGEERPLKIAMLSAHSCPLGKLGTRDTGGMSVYLLELARELGKLGHQVDVYTRVHDPRDKLIYDLGPNSRLIHLLAGENGEIHKLAVYPHLPDFAWRLEDFRSQNQLRYDLVYSHYWLSAWVGKRLQKGWGVPHMVMFHTLGAVKNAIGVGGREPELRIKTEKSVVRSCDRIIAATEREKEDLVRFYGAPSAVVKVVPCGVNTELFQPLDRRMARDRLALNGDKHLLYVGRIEPLKGIDRLLRAVSYLKERRPLRLLIIGGDENSHQELERLKILAAELQIQDRVVFLGLVKQSELPLYYSAADVCVVPSYYESFGLVTLESLACGTPVVATAVGSAASVIRQGETGYVISDNDPYLLADRIDSALSMQNNGSGLASVMRASLAPYRWPAIAMAVVRECRSLLRHEIQAGRSNLFS
jgi:D-inositol-3-phosphate glycosyltransferase